MFKVRKVFLFVIAILLFSLIPINIVDAHTTLEEATPNEGEQLKDTINSIMLTFSTKVENGSTLYLVNEDKEEIEPTSIDLNENILEATFNEPLISGTYQVNWKIIGADGHLIENQYSFSIATTEDNPTQPESDQNKIDSKLQNDQKEIATENEQNSINSNQQSTDEPQISSDNQSSSLVTGIIIFLTLGGVVLLTWLLLSKRKK